MLFSSTHRLKRGKKRDSLVTLPLDAYCDAPVENDPRVPIALLSSRANGCGTVCTTMPTRGEVRW